MNNFSSLIIHIVIFVTGLLPGVLYAENLPISVGVFPSDVFTYGPENSTSYYSIVFLSQVGQTIIEQDGTGGVIPGLAKSWKISPDRTTYTFTIREDILFHDGTPLKIDDIIQSLNSAIYSPLNAAYFHVPIIKNYEAGAKDKKCKSIEKLSNSEFRITLKHPYSPFLKLLSCAGLAIQKLSNSTKYFIGSGPYKIVANKDGLNSPYLEANSNYKGQYPAKNSRLNLIANSEILKGNAVIAPGATPDIDLNVNNSRRTSYEKDKYNFLAKPSTMISGFYVNTKNTQWKNKKNRDQLLGGLLKTLEKLPTDEYSYRPNDLYPKGMLGHQANRQSYNALVERAMKTSLVAGHQRPIKIGVFSPIFGGNKEFAEKFFSLTGRKVEFVQFSNHDFITALRTKDYDVAYLLFKSMFLDPDTNLSLFNFVNTFGNIGLKNKFESFRDQGSASSIESIRYKLYSEFVDFVFNQSVFIPAFGLDEVLAIRKNLKMSPFQYRYSPMFSEAESVKN